MTVRAIRKRVTTGLPGGRGGRDMRSGSAGSIASGSASVTVAIRFTHSTCVGVIGNSGSPSTNGKASTATSSTSASPRLVGSTNAIAFCRLS